VAQSVQGAVAHVPGPSAPQTLTHSACLLAQDGVGPVQSNVAPLSHAVCPSPQVHAMIAPSSPHTANVVDVVVEDVVVVVVAPHCRTTQAE
jgi:hypothetical protein